VAKVGADRRDAHRETEERCQFSVIPVFSRAAARFGQDIGNTSGLFLILRGFAPLREIHGGGYAAQVGRFGAPNPTSFYSGKDGTRLVAYASESAPTLPIFYPPPVASFDLCLSQQVFLLDYMYEIQTQGVQRAD
jgi:hypothetical protein